ncbi:MAG: hypothetical protein FWD89_01920 [Firmicutes bacterium]|nr:hypothetical protein [Bacillota bacterium]
MRTPKQEQKVEIAKLIMSTLITTGAQDKDTLLKNAKVMRDTIEHMDEYSTEQKMRYKIMVEFIDHLWRDDFRKIKAIVFEENA